MSHLSVRCQTRTIAGRTLLVWSSSMQRSTKAETRLLRASTRLPQACTPTRPSRPQQADGHGLCEDATVATDQHRDALLSSSLEYTTAKPAFANAIVLAQRAGERDEEIARVTGYTVPMTRAVLRTPV
jgi:hypothetical protein